jgi:DNA-binding transcriptional LysR family regulator
MMSIDYANLAKLDLNLLVAFDALMSERSVTKAALRVGLGQSAMSHNLARLRDLLGDEILTRAPEGMRPTPRALALIKPVRASLTHIQGFFAPRPDFDPRTTQQVFRLGLPDSMEVLLMPQLLAHLCERAPNIRLRLHTVGGAADLLDDLDADKFDLAIGLGPMMEGRNHHKQRPLFKGHYLCVFNAALVGLSPPISLEDYVRLPHVLTSLRLGERGVVDDALARLGHTRTVALTTPRFLAVPFLVRSAPVITTMHAQLARLFAAALGLTLSPPPVTLPDIAISLVWHASYDHDPAHIWLRQTIARLAADTARSLNSADDMDASLAAPAEGLLF